MRLLYSKWTDNLFLDSILKQSREGRRPGLCMATFLHEVTDGAKALATHWATRALEYPVVCKGN